MNPSDPLFIYFLLCEQLLLDNWQRQWVTFTSVGSAKHRKVLHLLAKELKLQLVVSVAAPSVWYVNPRALEHPCIHFVHDVHCSQPLPAASHSAA
jgi:hypothetical protein